jgi:hypothetical protein
MSQDSSVSVVTRLWAGWSGAGIFFLWLHIQTVSGVHPASYPLSTGISFPRGEAARV